MKRGERMKTTRTCKINSITKEQTEDLITLIRTFESAKRYSFNRLIEGENEKELIKKLQPKYLLNKRFCEDAILQAQSILFSQKELLPVYLENNQKKLEKTLQKIDDYERGKKRPKQVALETCLIGLRKRKQKLEQRIETYAKHIKNKTLPPIIFGGRKNFYERMKNKISNQEWKDLRTRQLYSRGDKSKKGNLNMRITVDDCGQGWLEIANPLGRTNGKTKSPRIKVPIMIPYRFYHQITTKLRILVASMEESKKNTQKVYKKWLQTIQTWKEYHNWKLWSILHKTVYMNNQQVVFKI